jgi:hypothetical protein
MSAKPQWSSEIRLAPEAQSVPAARRFVALQLAVHDLPMLVDDIVLVASELATNAFAHARSSFTVRLVGTGKAVTLVVKDGSTAVPALVNTEGLEVAGRGVAIVDLLSSEWGVIVDPDSGKAVWAAFDAVEPG